MARQRRLVDPNDGRKRCKWAAKDPLLATYHDLEWGEPIRTDAGHLERMALEIFQCGLSWKIVLVKRPALRRAFRRFSVGHVAAMTERDVDRLCRDASIVRNRRKIEATVHNAHVFQELAEKHGSYRRWLNDLPVDTLAQQAALYPLFRKMFRFMGPETTKCYLMGTGKVPPWHERGCWRRTCS
ncbi:MAG: DNA-3-methyladenine glycosylase I [Phycisphaerae bacterium]|nr:DNA-3-methyladenine glycosylase I [Phycisphaerae bacterium]